jgi:hypothetical protein
MKLVYTYDLKDKPEICDLVKQELDERWDRIVDTSIRVARKKYRNMKRKKVENAEEVVNN